MKSLLLLAIMLSGSGALASGPLCEQHYPVYYAPTVPVATFAPAVPTVIYAPIVVQKERLVRVVTSEVEYRPMIVPDYYGTWNYYPMPVYGRLANYWTGYNY